MDLMNLIIVFCNKNKKFQQIFGNKIIVMKKKQFEKGWGQLCLKYRDWEDMQAKGRMKMKKKRNKEGKQYYDFDFSRHQYYYSYPTNHIGLASPANQKQFINTLIQKTGQNPTSFFMNNQNLSWQQLDNILKPLELHQFLRDMELELNEKITTLRIQKALRIKKMKGLFGKDNQIQKQMIQLIEAQIRSLCHKKIRIHDKLCLVGCPLHDRVKDLKSFLKQRSFDEYQFTDLSKSDIVVLMRIRYVKQALSFNSHILIKIITNLFKRENGRFKRNSMQKKAEKVYNKKKQITELKQKLSDKITRKVNQHHHSYFDENNDSKIKLQNLIESLDYMKCIQENIQQNLSQKIFSKNYTSLKINYDETKYVPFDYSEVKSRLVNQITYYFNKTLIDEQVINGSDEHISYKINNLCFLQLKVLWETYNYSHKKEESSLIKIRSMMKKQLELVYSRHIKNLLNIRQHSIKVPANQKWSRGLLFHYVPQNEKQSIMEFQIKRENRFKDPMICSFLNLFGVNKDTTVRQQIEKYVQKSMEKSAKLFEYRSLYYKNSSGDQKTHIVNVLNKNISIMKEESDQTIKYFFSFLYQREKDQKIGFDILRSYYMLLYVRCSEIRYQIMQILNGQLMCLIKTQSRIKLLWKKSKIPFQLSKQFIDRFIESAQSGGYEFVSPQQSESHIDGIFKQMYNEDADKDYLNWKAQIGIQVRRKRSDNPLLEGKSVIFDQSSELLEECLTRIQFLCSETINKRQTFLYEAKLTQIVDRLEILLQFLTLEQKFQQAKLRIMDLYTEQLLRATSARGIILNYEQMNKVFYYNNIVDLTQNHFGQCYRIQTSCLEAKAQILKLLIKKQQKFEFEFGVKQFNQFRQANVSHTQPEISSMYYTEEITIQQQTEIIEQQARENQTDSLASDTQSQINNVNTGRLQAVSQASSLPDGSQYHLRTSFQEVLSKNSIKKIQSENNKKQQLMNKKKQKTINDTILGSLLPRNKKQTSSNADFYYYSYFAGQIMKKIDQLLTNYFLYPENLIKAQFLNQLIMVIENYSFEEYKNLIKPEQLTVCLNTTHKIINKYLEKVKTQGNVSSRGASQHWLCVNSKIIQNIITGQTGEEIDQLRGLYICLNAMHINEINFRLKQIEKIEKSKFSQFKYFTYLTDNYSADRIDPKQCLIEGPSCFQKRSICFFKLYSDIKEGGEQPFLSIGNYTLYFKAISAFDFAMNNLVSSFNDVFNFIIQELDNLESEMLIMDKYQCCQSFFYIMNIIPGIDNRLLIRKKLQFLTTFKKTVLPKQLSTQIAEILQSCCRSIPKFRKLDVKMTLNNIANLAAQFETYINQIMKSSIFINMVAEELKSQVNQKKDIRRLKKMSSLLPFIDKHLTIQLLPSTNLANIFIEHREIILAFQTKSVVSNSARLTLTQDKFSVKRIIDHVLGAGETVLRFIRQQYLKRKKQEVVGDPKKIQFQKYFERHFPSINNFHQTQLQLKVVDQLRDTAKYNNIRMFRRWMQCQFLIFGSCLVNQQLVKFRKMLINPQMIFHVFWDNNVKNLIGSRELSKLRTQILQSKHIINTYQQQYQTYMHLKKIYKNFVEDLSDYQFEQETHDCFLVLYTGAPQFFNPKQQDWNFLTNFCNSFSQKPNTRVDFLCDLMDKLNTPLGYDKCRLFNYPNKQKKYNVNLLKYYLWNSQNKNKIGKIDGMRRFIKQKLTQSKSLAIRGIKDEVIMPFYRNQRIIEILTLLGLEVDEYQLDLEDYRVNFDKYVHEGLTVLNNKELFIFNMTEKNIQSKGQLIKTKDEIMKIIMNNQYYFKLLREQFYRYCINIVENEVSLRKILNEDMQNEQASRDQKVLKQTINKILVPKVKLNPFLSSPLRTQNHFFAGTIKLSFIDQFLNKLRNRAVMIELAEGGTGYLLKVNELDQSVDVLCKAIVGFSEKEFTDRLRTVYDTYQQVKERNAQLKQQNNNYKAVLKCLKQYQNRQIKSLLYQKMNDYIVGFYQRQKTYEIIVNLLKTLENKMQSEINKKYRQKIAELQRLNKQLNEKLGNLRTDCSQIIKSNTNQAKDSLFNSFKQRAERILNKHFIEDISQNAKYQTVQSQDSDLLLRKLMMQKSFYELKIAKIQGNFQTKIDNLQKKIMEQSKLQNLLLMQQQKNKTLSHQVKQLQKCSIQNQLLKKQMSKKEQEQTTQKFRLVKVNESLKGKIKRMEDDIEQEKNDYKNRIQEMTKSESKKRSNFSVQVSSQDNKLKRKTFHIRTETNAGFNTYDIGLWKQKWVKSQKKAQTVIEGVRKAYQHFIFTKNAAKLCQKLKEILSQFQNRRIDRFEKT